MFCGKNIKRVYLTSDSPNWMITDFPSLPEGPEGMRGGTCSAETHFLLEMSLGMSVIMSI